MTTQTTSQTRPIGLITGASRGFGRALVSALAKRGWRLVIDARNREDLDLVAASVGDCVSLAGDVTAPMHRSDLVAAVGELGPLDLLVNNASDLGPSPLPTLAQYPLADLRRVYETNTIAPLALTQLLLPALTAAAGTVVNISSDAAIETYEGWGGYGSSKAALDQLGRVLATENEALRVYGFDPGDMRTGMHQRAFPGEDISDRPEPETVVPALLHLLAERPPSGRYRAVDLTAVAGAL